VFSFFRGRRDSGSLERAWALHALKQRRDGAFAVTTFCVCPFRTLPVGLVKEQKVLELWQLQKRGMVYGAGKASSSLQNHHVLEVLILHMLEVLVLHVLKVLILHVLEVLIFHVLEVLILQGKNRLRSLGTHVSTSHCKTTEVVGAQLRHASLSHPATWKGVKLLELRQLHGSLYGVGDSHLGRLLLTYKDPPMGMGLSAPCL
jgi:hypothetical protein